VIPLERGWYHVREGSSIIADFQQIHRAEGMRLWHIRGQYYGTFFHHLSGEALLLARYHPAAHGVEMRANAALCVDNRFHGFLVHLFTRLFGRLVDGRFSSYMDIAEKLCVALASDPEGVYNRLSEKGALGAGEGEEFRTLFLKPER